MRPQRPSLVRHDRQESDGKAEFFAFFHFRSRLDLSQNSPQRLVSPRGFVKGGTNPLTFQINVRCLAA